MAAALMDMDVEVEEVVGLATHSKTVAPMAVMALLQL
jgi:hypothetical protein